MVYYSDDDCSMIQACLIIKPAMDKTAFHHAVESVTGKNYLRNTDDRNLREHTAEILSILEDYGHPHEVDHLVDIGFLFVGTADLISQIPSIVTEGRFLTNQEASSQLLGSMIAVASKHIWKDSCFRAQNSSTNVHLRDCFNSVSDQLNQLTPPSLNRLRLN